MNGLRWGAVAGLVFLAGTSPALADSGLPPAKYDLAPNATTVEEVEQMEISYFGELVLTWQVPIGEAGAKCNELFLQRYSQPYPASETADGSTLYGCLMRDIDMGHPQIVISVDPFRPGLAAQLLRHELGHLAGWPNDHPR